MSEHSYGIVARHNLVHLDPACFFYMWRGSGGMDEEEEEEEEKKQSGEASERSHLEQL